MAALPHRVTKTSLPSWNLWLEFSSRSAQDSRSHVGRTKMWSTLSISRLLNVIHFCDYLQSGSPRRRYRWKDFIPDDVTSLRQKLSVHRAAISTFLELSVSFVRLLYIHRTIRSLIPLTCFVCAKYSHRKGKKRSRRNYRNKSNHHASHDNGVRLVDALGRSIGTFVSHRRYVLLICLVYQVQN